MADRRIGSVAVKATLDGTEKLPIDSGEGNAETATAQQVANLAPEVDEVKVFTGTLTDADDPIGGSHGFISGSYGTLTDNTFTIDDTTYTIGTLIQLNRHVDGGTIELRITPSSALNEIPSDYTLQLGSRLLEFSAASSTVTEGTAQYRWLSQPQGSLPDAGSSIAVRILAPLNDALTNTQVQTHEIAALIDDDTTTERASELNAGDDFVIQRRAGLFKTTFTNLVARIAAAFSPRTINLNAIKNGSPGAFIGFQSGTGVIGEVSAPSPQAPFNIDGLTEESGIADADTLPFFDDDADSGNGEQRKVSFEDFKTALAIPDAPSVPAVIDVPLGSWSHTPALNVTNDDSYSAWADVVTSTGNSGSFFAQLSTVFDVTGGDNNTRLFVQVRYVKRVGSADTVLMEDNEYIRRQVDDIGTEEPLSALNYIGDFQASDTLVVQLRAATTSASATTLGPKSGAQNLLRLIPRAAAAGSSSNDGGASGAVGGAANSYIDTGNTDFRSYGSSVSVAAGAALGLQDLQRLVAGSVNRIHLTWERTSGQTLNLQYWNGTEWFAVPGGEGEPAIFLGGNTGVEQSREILVSDSLSFSDAGVRKWRFRLFSTTGSVYGTIEVRQTEATLPAGVVGVTLGNWHERVSERQDMPSSAAAGNEIVQTYATPIDKAVHRWLVIRLRTENNQADFVIPTASITPVVGDAAARRTVSINTMIIGLSRDGLRMGPVLGAQDFAGGNIRPLIHINFSFSGTDPTGNLIDTNTFFYNNDYIPSYRFSVEKIWAI